MVSKLCLLCWFWVDVLHINHTVRSGQVRSDELWSSQVRFSFLALVLWLLFFSAVTSIIHVDDVITNFLLVKLKTSHCQFLDFFHVSISLFFAFSILQILKSPNRRDCKIPKSSDPQNSQILKIVISPDPQNFKILKSSNRKNVKILNCSMCLNHEILKPQNSQISKPQNPRILKILKLPNPQISQIIKCSKSWIPQSSQIANFSKYSSL